MGGDDARFQGRPARHRGKDAARIAEDHREEPAGMFRHQLQYLEARHGDAAHPLIDRRATDSSRPIDFGNDAMTSGAP